MLFAKIKGQDSAISVLKGHIRDNRIASAYLFSGPDSTGKKMAAEAMAAAVNCQGASGDACGNCPICLKITKHEHPDVYIIDVSLELDADPNRKELYYGSSDALKIGHIRLIQKRAALKPFEARRKFFIIDNAHNLTPEASNALLKVLEEPPSDSHIILISSKPHLLFKTITSRCRIIKFSPLPRQALEVMLKKEHALDPDSAHFLAYYSEGRIGEALRLKDSGLFREKNKIIDSFALQKGAGSFFPADRRQMRNCLNILSGWLRDSCVLKGSFTSDELINRDRKQDLLRYAGSLDLAELEDAFQAVADSFLYLEANANLKLLTSNLKAQLWRR